MVRVAKDSELDAWKRLEVFPPIRESANGKSIVETRWVLTSKTADGEKHVKT